jgi:hypothetical protein
MPNWVGNYMTITEGDPEAVYAFIRSDKSLFDFNKLIPMPEELYSKYDPSYPYLADGTVVVKSEALKRIEAANREKYGAVWYYWQLEHWGCKWGAFSTTFITDKETGATELSFDTPFAPPLKVFEFLAQQFPEQVIEVYSFEETNHGCYFFTLRDGKVFVRSENCNCFWCGGPEDPLTKGELDALGVENLED